ncbi:hypothetical protein N2152v2_009058 [Parachlorella kessleri]
MGRVGSQGPNLAKEHLPGHQLATQMQQMKLSGPPGALPAAAPAGFRPGMPGGPPQRPALPGGPVVPLGARAPGAPIGHPSGVGMPPRPAGGMPGAPTSAIGSMANGLGSTAPAAAGAGIPQRPAGPLPRGPPLPQGVSQAPGLRPTGMPGTLPPAAARPPGPFSMQQPVQPGAGGPPKPGLMPAGMPAPVAAPGAAPLPPPGVRPASGFSTPTKRPPAMGGPPGAAAAASPPPFSLRVGSNTPSPVKRPPGGPMLAGSGFQQQHLAGAPGQLGGLGYLQQAGPGMASGLRPPYGMPPPTAAGGIPGLPPPPQPPAAPGMVPPMAPGMMQPPQPPGMHHPPPGPMGPGGSGGGGSSSSSSKIDPSQIPRPLAVPLPTQVFETRRENTHTVPLPAEMAIVVKDRGSAGPRYLRSLLNMVPHTADILKHTCLPFVVMVNPLALPDPGDDPIEVVDFGESGPVRCPRCKAYVNPYFRWQDGGRKMQCNFCNATSETPPDYVCHLGPDGQRRDKFERPELSKGSVELVATKEYMVRPPMSPVHFFLIDVSHPAVSTGATAAVCSSIAKILQELPGGDRTEVCIATFDSTIHFYSLRPGQSQPHMLVVPDVTDVYCPLAGNVVVNLQQSLGLVEALLDSIPRMFASTQVMETCAGAALRSAIEALKGGAGGKVHAFISSLPRRGVLSLRQRDLGRPPTDRDNMESLLPENKDFQALALDAAEHQVCVDAFFLTQGYVDVATFSVLTTTTCGSLYHYSPFEAAVDSDAFHNDLRWNVIRPQASCLLAGKGLEAVGRLRASQGLTVDKYIGPYYKRTLTDLNFPAISSDHCVAAKLVHEDKLPESGEIYLQFALLYTTTGGERRIRLHTLALPITHSLGTTFRGADLDTYMAYMAKKVASQIPGHALGACKEAITKSATDALHAYRKQCASASSSGQLILPEALKLLPLYTLALTKAPCFRVDSKLDTRALWMARLIAAPVPSIVPAIYPRLLAVHTLLDRPENAPLVPDKLWVSAERLDSEGVYLLENGFEAFLYFGRAVPADVCLAILGLPSAEAPAAAGPEPPRPLVLPRLDNPLNQKIHQLLDEIRRQRCNYMRLRVVRRGDPLLDGVFFSALAEDRTPSGGMSYVEFLCFLHRQIQNKLS